MPGLILLYLEYICVTTEETENDAHHFKRRETTVIAAQAKNSTPSSLAKIFNALFSILVMPHKALKFTKENATINNE